MKNKTWIIAAMIAATAATASFAQPTDNNDGGGAPEHRRGPGRRPPPLPIIETLDANKDHVIDESEISNAAEALKALDKNSDGQLTADEYLPPRPNAQANPPEGAKERPLPPIVKALDANGDGTIDSSELANAPAALKTLDKNSDGKLTPDEFGPGRPPGHRGERERGPGQPGDDGQAPPPPPQE